MAQSHEFVLTESELMGNMATQVGTKALAIFTANVTL
jgi:hypothetical protein